MEETVWADTVRVKIKLQGFQRIIIWKQNIQEVYSEVKFTECITLKKKIQI